MNGRSSHPELDGTFCAVGDCIDPARALASAHVVLPSTVGMPDGFEYLTLDIPVCCDHQHLLRLGLNDWVLVT